jgi:hypothetical protein
LTFPLAPSPRTWAKNDIITVPRLRADVTNLAQLLTMRPALAAAQTVTGQSINSGVITPVYLDTQYLDNWSGNVPVPVGGGAAAANALYTAKFSGWYLVDGTVIYVAAASSTGYLAAGIQAVQNSVTSNLISGILTANGANTTGPSAGDLVQLSTATADTVSLFATQTTAVAVLQDLPGAYLKVWWAGLSGGTVVTSPQPAALWPPGSGTTITNAGGIAAGATSMTVGSSTGMVTGGTLGLDYYEGQAVSPMAETVTITSVTGLTIGISATSYPHGGTASEGIVAVPVSAAFMNQQVRDVINFLAYPPMLRVAKVTQSLTVQTFPASTTISGFTATTLDNFSGWNGSSTYTFPVSGVYYVYGQIPFQAAVNNYSAGISISGGTVQWGDSVRNQTGGNLASAIVRKVVRVTAGQTLTLQANITNNNVALENVSNCYATLVVVWKGF